ncbi:sigma-70 family RNA polymerase sigma factor [Enterococcus timonensis]|uniref:sigma-70 family RNA polymerase sigma factor n=1 Tax=Enterococcus timonensis TaxID=1852364 RepID=UPI0008DB260A|nr:sigma-70 family RNA polymerase sigma factor [Enterococcus timonensis]
MTENFMDYLEAHPRLVPGILKHCGLRVYQDKYQDYQQDVLLVLWEMWGESETLADFEKVAFTSARCRVLDIVRKEIRISTRTDYYGETMEVVVADFSARSEMEVNLFLASLPKFEKLICQHLLAGQTIAEIARALGCSRGKIYRGLGAIEMATKRFFK